MTNEEKSKAFSALVEHLESVGEYCCLTAEKVCRRGTIVDDPNYPDVLVVDVERHRAIAGTTYTKGLPMSAFETYLQRITWNPATKEISEVGETPLRRTIDYLALAHEHLFHAGPQVTLKEGCKRKRIVSISGGGKLIETGSLKKAIEAVREHYSSLYYEVAVPELGPEEASEFGRRLAAEVCDAGVEKLEDRWRASE